MERDKTCYKGNSKIFYFPIFFSNNLLKKEFELMKKGYTKEQIKNTLLKNYPEKTINKILIEEPELKLFERHRTPNNFLIGFMVIVTLFKLYDAIYTFEIFGIITIFLNILFILGLFKGGGWAYPIIFLFSLPGVYYAFGNVVGYVVNEIPAQLVGIEGIRARAVTLSTLNLISMVFVLVLSLTLWKKIHPDYKLKNLLTA